MGYDFERYAKALRFALEAHGEKTRKGTDIPYITHPVAVSAQLARYGQAEALVIAGLLHDTIEDAGVTQEEIVGLFGRRVSELVAGVTEEKERDGERVSWRERKEQQLAHLLTADRDVLTLKAADTLHNIRSILEDLRLKGNAVWERFRAGREEQVWYYTSVAKGIVQRLGEEGLAGELARAAEEFVKRASADG